MKSESWASSVKARKVMQGNRSRDTLPELAIRKLLHAAGLRYRVHVRPEPQLRRTADIVFPKEKVAVFVDGCFWHGCRQHRPNPSKTNSSYWTNKLARNKERDEETVERLQREGWRVLRFWEHDDPTSAALSIEAAVLDRRN